MLVSEATEREPEGLVVAIYAAVATVELQVPAFDTAALRTAPVVAVDTGRKTPPIVVTQVPGGMQF